MRKFVLLCMVSLMTMIAQGQKLKDSDVPASVKGSFAKLFPNAKEVKWSKESNTEYEAEFKVGKTEKSSNFDPTGKWLGTETEIKQSDLPAAVQATIAKEFAGYKIEEAEKAETPDKGIFYEVELEKGESNLEVQIDSGGKVIKKEEKKEEKEEKED